MSRDMHRFFAATNAVPSGEAGHQTGGNSQMGTYLCRQLSELGVCLILGAGQPQEGVQVGAQHCQPLGGLQESCHRLAMFVRLRRGNHAIQKTREVGAA